MLSTVNTPIGGSKLRRIRPADATPQTSQQARGKRGLFQREPAHHAAEALLHTGAFCYECIVIFAVNALQSSSTSALVQFRTNTPELLPVSLHSPIGFP